MAASLGLVAGRADAGEVRGRQQRRFREDPLDRAVGALARASAGAVGNGYEARGQWLESLDRAPEGLLHFRSPGRKELERHLQRHADPVNEKSREPERPPGGAVLAIVLRGRNRHKLPRTSIGYCYQQVLSLSGVL